MDRFALKSNAKAQIKGNIGILFLINLIMFAIIAACNCIPVIGQFAGALVLTPAMSLALIVIYLNLTVGKAPELGDLFGQFNNFWPSFKVSFLVGLFTGLWSLLLVIPGIIKAYSYSQAMYILAENPGMGALEAIDRSRKMMKGHKLDLFMLHLSFLGWSLLCGITLGIAGIYVIPYMNAANANFYNWVKSQPTVEY